MARNGRWKLSAVAEHAMTGRDVVWSAKIMQRADKMKDRRIKAAPLIDERDKKNNPE